MLYTKELESSVENAANFIASQCSSDGMWRDFRTLAGMSSDWVTGFVIHAATHIEKLCHIRLRAAKALIFRQRRNGGWSYNRSVPTDCDSTAWVLLALSTVPKWKPSALIRGVQYVKKHQSGSQGGYSTYMPSDGIDRFIGAHDKQLTVGWLSCHSCVSAVAVQSMLGLGEHFTNTVRGSVVQYFAEEMDSNGVWYPYWWSGYAYGTYQVRRALMMIGDSTQRFNEDTQRFLMMQQLPDGGWNDNGGTQSEAFSTAFNTLTLLLTPKKEIVDAAASGISWLMQHQKEDGSWQSSPILRIPPPMSVNPDAVEDWRKGGDGTGVIIGDENRIFTSAAALWAISTFSLVTK